MFIFSKWFKQKPLEKEIRSVLEEMQKIEPESKAYTVMANNLETLYNAKAKDKEKNIKPDTLIMAGVNLLGLIMVLNYEQIHVITSRAWGMIMKLNWRV